MLSLTYFLKSSRSIFLKLIKSLYI